MTSREQTIVRCESPHCRYPNCACADVRQGGRPTRRELTLACASFLAGVVPAVVMWGPR